MPPSSLAQQLFHLFFTVVVVVSRHLALFRRSRIRRRGRRRCWICLFQFQRRNKRMIHHRAAAAAVALRARNPSPPPPPPHPLPFPVALIKRNLAYGRRGASSSGKCVYCDSCRGKKGCLYVVEEEAFNPYV